MSTFKAVFATQQEGKPHVSLQQLDRASLPPATFWCGCAIPT